MYEAPDRYKRLISARLPGGESAGLANARGRDGQFAPARRPVDLARPARAILRRRQHRRRVDDGRQPVGRRRFRVAAAVGAGGRRGQSGRDAARPPTVDHLRRPLGPAGSEVAAGRRSRVCAPRLAQPPALFLRLARPGNAGHCRLDHGRPRDRRVGPGRDPALRHRVDGRLHAWRRGFAPDRPPHRALPAHAVDPVHARASPFSAC